MNNRHKITSVHGALLLRYEDIFSKKRFSGGEKLIWAKY